MLPGAVFLSDLALLRTDLPLQMAADIG